MFLSLFYSYWVFKKESCTCILDGRIMPHDGIGHKYRFLVVVQITDDVSKMVLLARKTLFPLLVFPQMNEFYTNKDINSFHPRILPLKCKEL